MDDSIVEIVIDVIDLLFDIFSDTGSRSRNTSYKSKSNFKRKDWKPVSFHNTDPINNVTSNKLASPSVVTSGMKYSEAEYVDDTNVVETIPYSKQQGNKSKEVKETITEDQVDNVVVDPIKQDKKEDYLRNVTDWDTFDKPKEDVLRKEVVEEDPVDNAFDAYYQQKEKSTANSLVNNVKLQILMLNYMFYEDDMKLSLKEKNQIKKHMSKYKGVLNHHDLEEIKEYSVGSLSVDTIKGFVSKYSINQSEINKATFELNQYNSNGRYTNLIDFIKRYVRESDY